MDSQRPNDVSPEAMQARIQQARREAETLKDRIKRKKDELADTTREFCTLPHQSLHQLHACGLHHKHSVVHALARLAPFSHPIGHQLDGSFVCLGAWVPGSIGAKI